MGEWTWLAGPLATIGGFVLTGVGVIIAVRRDVAVLSARLGPLEAAVLKLTEILDKLSRHDERLKSVERELERSYAREQRGQSGSG